MQSVAACQPTPESGITDARWGDKPAAHQPAWANPDDLPAITDWLAAAPGLVTAEEVLLLQQQLAAVAHGTSTIFMGGDCAELISETDQATMRHKVAALASLTQQVVSHSQLPVVTLGRMAGQFAKPRSAATETRAGVTLPSYQGDAVNSTNFTEFGRRADAHRLVVAYQAASRAITELRQPHHQLRFGRELFSCHEALLLDYETALTRHEPACGGLVNLGAHLVWVGERTRQLDHAHVPWLAQTVGPLAVKIGPQAQPSDTVDLLRALNPENIPGRLTLVVRLGADNVAQLLPNHIMAVERAGRSAAWVCDPMHGNTHTAPCGVKTRKYEDILAEVRQFYQVHHQLGSWPGGVHLEFSHTDVTEVVGGACGISYDTLADRYYTACDPRLNLDQTHQLIEDIKDLL